MNDAAGRGHLGELPALGVTFEEEKTDTIGVEAAEHVGAGRGGELGELDDAGNGLGAEKEKCSGKKYQGGCNEEERAERKEASG